MRGRAPHVLVGIVAAVLLVAGLVWWQSAADDPAARSCPVESALLEDPEVGLLPVAELLPEGTVGDERRPVVQAADEVAGVLDLGEVVSGRFHGSPLDVPALVPLDAAVPGHVLLAAPDAGGGQVLTAVGVPGGEPSWSRSFAAPMRGGGLVGEHLVVLSGGARPGVLTLDPAEGEVRSCLTLPVDAGEGTRLLADQAGAEIVLATATEPGVRVLKVDPGSAEVPWTHDSDALTEAGSVTVVPDEEGAMVVVGRTVADPVRMAELATAGDPAPSVEALALSDGRSLWTSGDGAVAVVGAGEGGTLVLLTASVAPDAPGDEPVFSLAALDTDGTELWRTELGREPVGAELWGDTVVVRGVTPAGRLELRAFPLTTGRQTWRLTTSTDEDGDGPDGGLGAGTSLGGRYVVPAPAGLLEVDPATGEHRLVRAGGQRLAVDQVLPVGDLVLIRSGAALLVVGPV